MPFRNEICTLRKVMNGKYTFRLTMHAKEEMKNDSITSSDIIRVLEMGCVTLIENHKKDVLWHVEGRDVDTRCIRVVLHLNEDAMLVKIITVMLI